MIKLLVGALVLLLLVCTAWGLWCDEKLTDERMAHDLTRACLKDCRAAHKQLEARAAALAAALKEAQAREAAWAEETAARAAIVRNAKPGPRPKAEQDQVVDNETRRAAMARLNAAW